MLIVANWKLHFNLQEVREWLSEFAENISEVDDSVEIVICPSFPLIPELKRIVSEQVLPVKLGAQDISIFEEGQYTGEVSGKQLRDWVNYVIVGHSERRSYFNETDQDVLKKILLTQKYQLRPIACISSLDQAEVLEGELLDKENLVIVYEPLFAIGTGQSDSPSSAAEQAQRIRSTFGKDVRVLYGGSVDLANVTDFLRESIDGVLVGTASLDPAEFAGIVKKVSAKG
ncbi:triose-phosphate isomerase [Patescibacteria group bacterium]|nr:triose-phosphate isomerase [Patescibacteria group bacterium]MBU1868056.1 triose-phosphate isomerase [Patescibacteria group bacterium]